MTTTLSKRHQARNERALQELIKTVPGNDRCADCGARNPGWASWSLGIFLCMRCASLHRQLGTHISKVKSLSMDSWSNEQVESMRRNGNVNSNRTFNPRNTKPEVPLDVDEVDAVLAKFVKQKYDQQLFSGGQARAPAMRTDTGNTGSTRSSEDQPPPLPPKSGKRFGFGLRSVSSALPLSRHHHTSPPQSPQSSSGGFNDPIRVNKQSRVFGASVGGGGNENIEAKLAQLRDMGFGDDRRNLNVLKGNGGNLERTIESLVRLGDGSNPTSRSRTPVSTRNIAVSQPLSTTTHSAGATNGISFEARAAGVSQTKTGSTDQTNRQSSTPFPEPPPAQPSAQVRSFSLGNPYQTQVQEASYNPFDLPPPQPQPNVGTSLNQAFQGMQISQQSQQPPLFPNATGGYPNLPPHAQDPRLQTMTPPIPQIPPQSNQSNPYGHQFRHVNGINNPFSNTTQQAQPAATNPYLLTTQQSAQQNTQSQTFNPSYNPFGQQQPVQNPQSNGYPSPQMYSPMTQQGGWGQSQPQSPQVEQGGFSDSQSPQMQQGGLSQNPTPHMRLGSFQQQPATHNPYAPQQQQQTYQQQKQQQQQQTPFLPQPSLADPAPYGMQHQYQYESHPQQQQAQPRNPYQTMPLQPQQTGRYGKNDILALYNYPELAPPIPPLHPNPLQQNNELPPPPQQHHQQTAESFVTPSIPTTARRSATMPALFPSGSNNPFGTAAPKPQPQLQKPPQQQSNGLNILSNPESTVDAATGVVGGFQNGRHSPDAFANLSASFAR